MTNAVDGEGLKKSVAAALSAGVSRFLLVSAFPESARGETTSESFENYMRVKKMADVELAQSELDWVILRPARCRIRLVRVMYVPAWPSYGNVPRDDVAATLAELIEQPAVSRVIIELTSGDAPVREAIQKLAGR
jgi:uncharacterized protein YbjT (DUF2867 family)